MDVDPILEPGPSPTHPPSPTDPVVRLRITHITSDQTYPIFNLRQEYAPTRFATAIPPGCLPHHVATIRIFGTTPSSQRVCANVHLCYPYFYVPYPMDSQDPLRPERVVKLCQRFAVSLNHAICLALRQNPSSTGNSSNYAGGVDPKHLHVMSVMVVKGIPFYGYHLGYSYFLKVSLANPSRLHIALDQLRKPNVLGREWQPHEAHLNHVLQFMCDFDLYGCGWLDLGGGMFREPLPEGDPYNSPPTLPSYGRLDDFNAMTIPPSMLYPPGLSPPKDSFTALEIDVLPHQILNRRRLAARELHHDFIELLHKPLDPSEKLVPAVAELWEDERRRRVLRGLNPNTNKMMPGSGGMDGRTMEELGYKVKKDASSGDDEDGDENKGGDWKISEELWGMLKERMMNERKRKGRLTFQGLVRDVSHEKNKWDRWIMTTFEAVSAHWPKQPQMKVKNPSVISKGSPNVNNASSQSEPATSAPVGPSVHPSARELTPTASADYPSNDAKEDATDSSTEKLDDQNPFEAFAMTQASQHFPDPEVSRRVRSATEEEQNRYDQYYADGEDDDDDERKDAEEARLHAEQTNKIRATQMPARQRDGDDDAFDDEELEELFRQTVATGLGVESDPTTPRKPKVEGQLGSEGKWAGWTPTKRSGGSTLGSLRSRKRKRDQRILDEAGLGDLSTIIDRSSVSLSPRDNPYDERIHNPSTPSRPKTPVSEVATPSSLMRNVFAKSRQASTFDTPSKRASQVKYDSSRVITLPPMRKTPGVLVSSPSASPEEKTKNDVRTSVQKRLKDEAIKIQKEASQKLSGNEDEDLFFDPELDQVIAELSLPPAGGGLYEPPVGANIEGTLATLKPVNGLSPTLVTGISPRTGMPTEHAMSPTFQDAAELSSSAHHEMTSSSATNHPDLDDRPRKRVRLAEPLTASQVPLLPAVLSQTDSHVLNAAPISKSWQYIHPAPSLHFVTNTMEKHGVSSVDYQPPFYSDPADIPLKGKTLAGRLFHFRSDKAKVMLDFQSTVGAGVVMGEERITERKGTEKRLPHQDRPRVPWRFGWEYAHTFPCRAEVVAWCRKEDEERRSAAEKRVKLTSQLVDPTQKNKYGFKFSQKKKVRDAGEGPSMSVLTLEIFAQSRGRLLPDPEKDAITGIFYCYRNEDEELPDTTIHPGYHAGYVIVGSLANPARFTLDGIPFEAVEDELELVNWVIDNVKYWDPDVLAGWEVHNSSWGYLSARAHELFAMDFCGEISRVISGKTGPKNDGYSAHHSSTFKVAGRHTLNIWRICRSEINLTQYTFENVVFHLLHQRIPHYSSASLTALWRSKNTEHACRVLKYFFQRAVICMEIIDQADIITKTAEFARVFGVDFASVMTRGSQYKVESFIFRIAKPESFLLVTPSKKQVGLQNAPFAIPLIAEPESKYYSHPIVVLDFQSLYPSIMIAYNICYSTCLGRVEMFKGTNKFGFTELKVGSGLLELLKDYLTVTPNGMIFVKPAVRKSLLAKMLGEILDTRVMIKNAMKGVRDDKSLTSMLNARQLGLKLMANVTYGYTSATYSGRMPCIEIADSIVQTGRETLEKAQELIHTRPDWDARVVYGDTDSLFVALPGRTKDQAFRIGHDIADAVTAMNPKPVKLKFEKVYMGSVLMAKKRYVGFKYEHPDDIEPVFDAKGIETVRRDGFPAQQKMEEVCLKLLFRTQDLSQIKDFCRREWTKILEGRVLIQDFIIAKEVRLGTYSEKGVPPPGAAVAYRRILKDPRDEPQYAERVPYLISNADGRRLIDRARLPEEMLVNRSLSIDAEYYIRNLLIPPLSRIFNLVGADVEEWYDTMPRTKRVGKYERYAQKVKTKGHGPERTAKKSTSGSKIDSHFASSHCLMCGIESSDLLCSDCRSDPSIVSHTLISRQQIAQEKLLSLRKLCASCSATPPCETIMCDSTDCPITYAKVGAEREIEDLEDVGVLLQELDD